MSRPRTQAERLAVTRATLLREARLIFAASGYDAAATEEIVQHLEWADVLVMTSYFEGVPLIILEAGQLGCPTIAPAVGAIPEIISHDVNGVLVGAEGDESAFESEMVAAIQRFVADPAWRASVSQNCFDSFSGKSWDDTAKVMADHFELT